jgi:hypothetical protein
MSRGFVTDGRMMSTLEHDGNRLRFREQPDPPRRPPAAPVPPVDAPLPQANAPVPQAFVSARPPQRHLEPLVIDLARWLGGVAEFLATVTAVSLVVAAVTLVRKARAALIEFADRPADPLTAGVARILFAASGIWYAATLTGYIELNWYSQSPAVRTCILYGHWFWIGTLVLLLLGIGGRLVAFLQLAIAVLIFNADDLGSTVSSDLYLIGSFWLSFTRLDGRLRLPLPRWIERRFPAPSEADALPKAWPLVLLGINDGVLLLTSGISKFFDPFWIRGIGFYETFALPWIKDPAATVLLKSESLMMVMNYGGIAVEILFLPLFFLKRTRAAACIIFVSFFAMLTWPIRIDFIGPVGMIHGIALAAAVPSLARRLNRLTRSIGLRPLHRKSPDELIVEDDPVRARLRRTMARAVVGLFVVYVGFWSLYSTVLVRFNPWFTYPLTQAKTVAQMLPGERPPEITGPSSWIEPYRRQLLYFFEDHVAGNSAFVPLDLANRLTTRMGPKVLFCATHFIGIYEYRVTLTLADGRQLEPVQVFNDDKTAGPYTAGAGCPRCLQRLMYDVTSICQDRLNNPKASPDQEHPTLDRLIHFSISKLPPAEQDQVTRADVLVSPIVVPLAFEGDSRPWLGYPWTRLYERDTKKSTARFCEPPALYPDQLVMYRAR